MTTAVGSDEPPAAGRVLAAARWALLALFTLLALTSAATRSVTSDEPGHWQYGARVLVDPAKRLPSEDGHMPVTWLHTVPWQVVHMLGLDRRLLRIEPPGVVGDRARLEHWQVVTGRSVTVAIGMLLLVLIHRWAAALYGPVAGLLALSLAALSPNLLAHGRLVTTDVAATAAIAWTVYLLWRAWQRPVWSRWVAVGGAGGLALVTKYTAVMLAPVAVLTIVAAEVVRRWQADDMCGPRRWRRLAVGAGGAAMVAVVALNAVYLGRGSGTPLAEVPLESAALSGLRRGLGPLAALPAPVPAPWLRGLDMVIHHDRTGETFGNLYLMGERRDLRAGDPPFAAYFLIVALFKIPLATMLLAAGAVADRVRGGRAPAPDEMFVLAPLLLLGLYLNLGHGYQIGLRHVLPCLPFAFVAIGGLGHGWRRRRRSMRWAVGGAVAWLAVSVVSYHPHYLPYVNELAGARAGAWRLVADSNLDWGQARGDVARYRATAPPTPPGTVRIVVGASNLVGVTGDDELRWLREGFEPVGHVSYSWLVFEVPRTAVPERYLDRAAR